jgi:hypothetical protein
MRNHPGALKTRPIIAQGNALGSGMRNHPGALKGAT